MDLTSRLDAARRGGLLSALVTYDLTAAFDCIDKGILDRKLEVYGFNMSTRNWVSSYLSGRKQNVAIQSFQSSNLDLNMGSPQGSILSPLLFTVLMADLEMWLHKCNVVTYADDTTIWSSKRDVMEARRDVEEDSVNFLSFMASNGLVANPSKTEAIVIGRSLSTESTITNVSIGGHLIPISDSITILGVIFDKSLSWKFQFQSLIRQLHKRLGLIKRLLHWIPRERIHPFVDGLVISKLRYCLPVFGSVRVSGDQPKNGYMDQIQVFLNDLMRLLVKAKRSDKISIKSLISSTGLPSVNQLCADGLLNELYRFEKFEMNLAETFSTQTKLHQMELRGSRLNLCQPIAGSRGGMDLSSGIFLWNKVICQHDITCKMSEYFSVGVAKREFKKIILLLPV